MKTLSSPILFKQIIGRGSRVDPAASVVLHHRLHRPTRLLDPKWDKPPDAITATADERPAHRATMGTVRPAESGDLLVGASIAALAGFQRTGWPIMDDQGRYCFDRLPVGEMKLIASGPKLVRRELQIVTEADGETLFDIELKPAGEQTNKRIKATGLETTIADEATFIVAGVNEPMSLEQYLDYTRDTFARLRAGLGQTAGDLREPEPRPVLVEQLEWVSIDVEVLAEALASKGLDEFEPLANLAYGRPLRSR